MLLSPGQSSYAAPDQSRYASPTVTNFITNNLPLINFLITFLQSTASDLSRCRLF